MSDRPRDLRDLTTASTKDDLHSPDAVAGDPRVAGRRALVVEDDAATRRAMCRLLQSEGWNATGCKSVAEAVGQVEADPDFGALLIDVWLPDGDGVQLARDLRPLVGQDARIIVLSGDHSVDVLKRLGGAGIDRFIGKPLSVDALLHALDGQPLTT